MFEEIRSNKRRSVVLILVFVSITVLIGVLGGYLIGGGPVPTIIAFAIAAVTAVVSYW
ncbi:MAG: hypothetical protein ACO276_08165 [Ilumatobacteraceae bacterium]